MKSIRAFLVLAAVLVSAGMVHAQTFGWSSPGGQSAAIGFSGSDYGSNSVRSAQAVKAGIVQDVLSAQVTQDASATSRVIGASAGAAVCAPITARWHSWQAQAAAMALCGAVGERVGNSVGTTQVRAATIVVRMEDGQMLAVVQDDPYIQRGDRVYVLSGNGATRVMKAGV